MRVRERTARRLFSHGAGIVTVIVSGLFCVAGRAADVEHGEELFEEHCSACHTVIGSVRDKSGPNLNGVFGRLARSEEYSGGYSEEMAASGVTWEVATLQAFVNSPALMVRGTKMVFRGLPEYQARLDLVCYLERVTGDRSAVQNELCVDNNRD